MIERYARSPMKDLWTDQALYERWLEVELAATEAGGDSDAHADLLGWAVRASGPRRVS